MSCPICGANCKCRKRGPGGICCGCHKHKPRAIRANFKIGVDSAQEEKDGWRRHQAALWQPNTAYSIGDLFQDRNGNLQQITVVANGAANEDVKGKR